MAGNGEGLQLVANQIHFHPRSPFSWRCDLGRVAFLL